MEVFFGYNSPKPERVWMKPICYQCTAQTARFRVIEIISVLGDIPRMCFLYVSFDGGCTVWAIRPPR